MKLLVTGGTRFIRTNFIYYWLKNHLEDYLVNLDYDFCVNFAAYINVDKAETEKELAYKVNVHGTRNVFELVQSQKKKFIQISTGFVFDGIIGPYDESSIPLLCRN